MSYYFSPSELNYITCKRCFFLKKIKKFEYKGAFPRVFNDFDICQKNYFISKNTNDLSKKELVNSDGKINVPNFTKASEGFKGKNTYK